MLKSRLLLFLLAACPLYAQTPYLVKDINTTVSFGTVGSGPTQFTACRNKVFFVATATASGQELWSTDGSGTALVADILPGTSSSQPTGLVCVNDKLLFSARDVDHGFEYWTSDGTAAGTKLLADLSPGPNSSAPAAKIVYKNQLLFVAEDGTSGRELWTTDGTASGTRLVKDIAAGSASSSPNYFVTFGNAVYFSAANALWKTDGTSDGTVKVASVPARNLTVAGSQLFFEGFTSTANWEPWVSDGTESGTRMIVDLRPGTAAAFDTKLSASGATALGNRVLFIADDGVHGRELWISDGTVGGTHLVYDSNPGTSGPWDNLLFFTATIGGRVFFTGWDAQHGYELWSTDGTEAGTSLFYDVIPGTESSTPALTQAGDKIYFRIFPSASSDRLWVTDGSTTGTHLVGPASPTTAIFVSADPVWPVGDKLYFAGSTRLAGTEPWVTDGTDSGTRMILNIGPDRAPSSTPLRLTVAGNYVYFYAVGDSIAPSGFNTSSLWRSDGTEAGTVELLHVDQVPDDKPIVVGSQVLFFPRIAQTTNAYMSDGTVEGTSRKRADDFYGRFGPWPRPGLQPVGDVLFAQVEDRLVHDTSLWFATAPDSVVRLGARNPGREAAYGDRYVFFGQGVIDTFTFALPYKGLWTTDLTPAGTYALIPDLGNYDQIYGPVFAGGTLYFVKQLHNEKPKLWKSDGTVGGTSIVLELPVPFVDANGVTMFEAGRRLFFTLGTDLWTSDGSAAGTFPISDHVERLTFDPPPMYAVGDRLVFRRTNLSSSNTSSYELWSSDGTVAGTKFLAKLPTYFDVQFPRGSGQNILFPSSDTAHGNEIWTTDGTPEGTRLFVDVNPGPASSDPSSMVRLGDTVYFSAYTDAVGTELWALPFTEPSLTIADAHVAEGAGGATAHLTVSLTSAARQAVAVDYATADGSAHAGDDYTSTSGTLNFAVGETTKTIDVPIRGDGAAEGNEAFFVTLKNARSASIAKSDAVVVIDDDDRTADLNVTAQFDSFLGDAALVRNDGPQPATDIQVTLSSTPSTDRYPTRCTLCAIPQLDNGGTATSGSSSDPLSKQIFVGAAVAAREHDPRPSNDVATWTVSAGRWIVMTPAFVSVGGTATVTVKDNPFVKMDVISSDPSIATVSPVTKSADGKLLWSATVTGLKPGTVTLTSAAAQSALSVDVVAAGARPRWPNGVGVDAFVTTARFEQPFFLTINPSGRSPLNGAAPTGTITVTADGAVTQYALNGTDVLRVPLYLHQLGADVITINYSGDAEFLPQTYQQTLFATKGQTTMTGVLEPVSGTAGSFTLTVGVDGSPAAAPTGVVTVMNGTTEVARLTLVAGAAGESTAKTTLANLTASPTLTLNYSGDSLYNSATQQIRAIAPRHRGVRH